MIRELVVDNFAGGGGASTGIELAIGRSVDIAINHDEHAIAMHETNHPETLHYCESVFDVDPVAATSGKPVALAWFSPDCRHFSIAKGGTPVKKEVRGLAWVSINWGLKTRPRVISLENVKEFVTWGPLVANENGDEWPCPKRRGETFQGFIAMLTTGIAADHPALAECCETLGIATGSADYHRLIAGLGYNVEYRELLASDYGTPQSRLRFFLMARCDGKPIVWPAPTHGDPKKLGFKKSGLKKWNTAGDIIDFSIPTKSIFGRKKDLADNTLRRIVKGMQRFVINSADPYIVRIGQTGFGGDRLSYSCDAPLTTITSKAEHLLVEPFVVKCNHTASYYKCFRGQSLNEPLQSVTQAPGFAVVAPVVIRQFGNSVGSSVDAPVGTIMPGGGGKTQLAAAHLVKHYGGNYTGAGVGIDEPMHTVTQVDHHTLCTSHLVHLRGTCKDGKPMTAPVPTVTSGGNHIGHVQAFLTKYYGTATAADLNEPAHSVTTKDRFGLASIQCEPEPMTEDQRYGAWWCARLLDRFTEEEDDRAMFPVERPHYIRVGEYIIVDIGMRMLTPRELYRAQGFPEWYIIDQDYKGRKYSKAKQTARCGNAVPPQMPQRMVQANLPELCQAREEVAA
ncbi:DNA (cytosine-5-)-methyltransferase [Serratia fonticola]|nr:DNA (cytosine-5-)-methyltransferase [Serratia fonticola]